MHAAESARADLDQVTAAPASGAVERTYAVGASRARLRARLRASARLALVALLVATGVAFSARFFWLGELVANLRWQLGLAALALCCGAALVRARWTAGASLVLAIHHLGPGLAWYVPAVTPRASGPEIVVATTNLWYCNKDDAALRAWLEAERPDVVALFEVGEFWAREIEALAPLYPHQRIVPSPDVGAGAVLLRRQLEDEPHEIISPYEVTWGLALIARHPLEGVVVHVAPECPAPYIEAQVTIGAARVHVVALHPERPGRGPRTARRNELLAHVARTTSWTAASVVLGDLNVTLYSPAYADFLATSGLVDTRSGFGRQPSWNPPYHLPGHWLDLDHILVSPGIDVVERELGPEIGSDHVPVLARLRLATAP